MMCGKNTVSNFWKDGDEYSSLMQTRTAGYYVNSDITSLADTGDEFD
jgi:hypothetical protein